MEPQNTIAKVRISAGKVSVDELKEWKQQMREDGFDALWTWICWIVRQHIRQQRLQREEK